MELMKADQETVDKDRDQEMNKTKEQSDIDMIWPTIVSHVSFLLGILKIYG